MEESIRVVISPIGTLFFPYGGPPSACLLQPVGHHAAWCPTSSVLGPTISLDYDLWAYSVLWVSFHPYHCYSVQVLVLREVV